MRAYVLLFCLVFYSCGESISIKKLPTLNGYWEINEVILPNGDKKEYNASTTIDYINVNGFEGYRKKVNPKLDGTYTVTNDAEFFTITQMGENFVMRYKNELSSWEEKLILLKDDSFAVENKEGIRYKYKRFEPIKIE